MYIIYIIYLYLLSNVQKFFFNGLPHVCYDLIVICYLLFVMIAPAQGRLVGASMHVLRPYCYLLFVICYLL